MSLLQKVTSVVGIGLCLTIVAILFRRRLWRVSYAWTGYLAVVGVADALIFFWPATFWTWGFWTTKELVLAVLKLCIGLELGALAFRRFPGADRAARASAAVALGLVSLVMVLAPRTSEKGLAGVALEAHARLSHGSALLLVSLGILVLWYRVPIHRLHRAILRGLATYLLLFSGGLRTALTLLSAGLLAWWNVVSNAAGLAYVAMLFYWLWEAARTVPEDELRGSAALEGRLAWRDRLGTRSE